MTFYIGKVGIIIGFKFFLKRGRVKGEHLKVRSASESQFLGSFLFRVTRERWFGRSESMKLMLGIFFGSSNFL
jgi:hypothetical protein